MKLTSLSKPLGHTWRTLNRWGVEPGRTNSFPEQVINESMFGDHP